MRIEEKRTVPRLCHILKYRLRYYVQPIPTDLARAYARCWYISSLVKTWHSYIQRPTRTRSTASHGGINYDVVGISTDRIGPSNNASTTNNINININHHHTTTAGQQPPTPQAQQRQWQQQEIKDTSDASWALGIFYFSAATRTKGGSDRLRVWRVLFLFFSNSMLAIIYKYPTHTEREQNLRQHQVSLMIMTSGHHHHHHHQYSTTVGGLFFYLNYLFLFIISFENRRRQPLSPGGVLLLYIYIYH